MTMSNNKDKDNIIDGHVSKYLVYILMIFISIGILVGIIFVLQHDMILDKVEKMIDYHQENLKIDINISQHNSEKLDKILELLKKT